MKNTEFVTWCTCFLLKDWGEEIISPSKNFKSHASRDVNFFRQINPEEWAENKNPSHDFNYEKDHYLRVNKNKQDKSHLELSADVMKIIKVSKIETKKFIFIFFIANKPFSTNFW